MCSAALATTAGEASKADRRAVHVRLRVRVPVPVSASVGVCLCLCLCGWELTESAGQGIVFTASPALGLRAWRLDKLIASTPLYANAAPFSGVGPPTAMAVDEASGGTTGRVNVAVGFNNGAFATYQLDMLQQDAPIFRTSLGRPFGNRTSRESPNAMVTAMAYLGPYLSTLASQTWAIYDFSVSDQGAASGGADGCGAIDSPDAIGSGGVEPRVVHVTGSVDDDDVGSSRSSPSPSSSSSAPPPPPISRDPVSSSATPKSNRMIHSITPHLHAPPPSVLASLQSSTAWPPSTLSLRRSANGTLVASVVYASPLHTTGWSVGMQELRFSTSPAAILEESRIATSVPSGFAPPSGAAGGPAIRSGSSRGGNEAGPAGVHSSHSGSRHYDPPLAQPTGVSYSHP